VDTIVADNIDELWDVDLEGRWFAAVLEDKSTYKPFGPVYYNIGVTMFNLKQIREDFADDLMIYTLNTRKMPYIDQDAWNLYWRNKSVQIPGRFNESIVTHQSGKPAIVHYAGVKNWQTNGDMKRAEYLKEARKLTWEEVLHGQSAGSHSDV
jgi:lipopolysaccharide biosynthesis glycosyltransferase